ncbi:hypothetical protein LTR29_002143 [Friedmanniomyces endolithicus]|nr:hypothetical protein LTR29_002143 [Friedmanniomyces endolithicus]
MSVAPPSASTGLAVTEPAPQPEAKKTRKNPQRRKTEQAKRQIEPAEQSTVDVKATHRPPLRRSQTGPATSMPSTQAPLPTDASGSITTKSGRMSAQSSAVKKQNNRDEIKAIAFAPAAIITGGLLGCAASAALLAGVGIWHEYNGTESAILAARTAKLCLDGVADDITTSLKAVPGGVAYVERLFREINLVRQSRGGDVDKVLRIVHGKLNRAALNGATPDAMRTIVVSQLARLSTVAGASVQDVMDRNPALKPLQGSPTPKVPTLNVNLVMKSKNAKG